MTPKYLKLLVNPRSLQIGTLHTRACNKAYTQGVCWVIAYSVRAYWPILQTVGLTHLHPLRLTQDCLLSDAT